MSIQDKKILDDYDRSETTNTVDENIIATIKMRNKFCYPLEMLPI